MVRAAHPPSAIFGFLHTGSILQFESAQTQLMPFGGTSTSESRKVISERLNYFLSPRVFLPLPEVTRQKVEKGITEIPNEIRRFWERRYPAFVTARSPSFSREEAPVFMFHKVEPAGFEEQLSFLSQNGYQTLSLRRYLAFLSGRLRLKNPAVVITFDDGDKSLHEVAFPLLRKYDFQAIAFVVPGCIEAAAARGEGSRWVSWGGLEEMERSGVIDVQSHSYYHDQIFTGPELLDFYHPQYESNPLKLDTPWLEDNGVYTNRLAEGSPLHRHAPSLAGQPRYFHDESVRRACIDFVAAQGGSAFFRNSDWRRKLGGFYFRRSSGSVPRFESPEEQKVRILAGLKLARQVLEERLNKPVRHLCYPWGRGSELAVSLSRLAGYESNFWVILPGGRRERISSFYIPRLKDDYLFRLPGRGRKSLTRIFQRKLRLRQQTLDLY
jgi:peptidoglycan/xylan/chitin deacetylase (PgdA/CDA1 family)